MEDIQCNRCRGTGVEPGTRTPSVRSSDLDPLDNVMNTACKACGGTGRGVSSAIGDQ